MSALSIQVPFPVFQDRDGQPLDNGYVWLGTSSLNPQTNPVVAYYDSALTIVATQPLRTLNGFISRAGSPAQVYVDAVNFSILVQDRQGTTVFSVPEGTGISPNASGVVYDPAGTGAVATTVQGKLRESVSVKDFGAVGDGVTDDTAAINLAKTALAKGRLYFPAGTYKCNITVGSNIVIVGEGRQKTFFTAASTASPIITFNETNSSLYYFIGGEDFTVSGQSTATIGIQVGKGSVLGTVTYGYLNRVEVHNCVNNVILKNTVVFTIDSLYSYSASAGALVVDDTDISNDVVTTLNIKNSQFRLSMTGLSLRSGALLKFENCVVENNLRYGAFIYRGTAVGNRETYFDTCWFEGNGTSGVGTYSDASSIYIDMAQALLPLTTYYPIATQFKNCFIGSYVNAYDVYLGRASDDVLFDYCMFNGVTGALISGSSATPTTNKLYYDSVAGGTGYAYATLRQCSTSTSRANPGLYASMPLTVSGDYTKTWGYKYEFWYQGNPHTNAKKPGFLATLATGVALANITGNGAEYSTTDLFYTATSVLAYNDGGAFDKTTGIFTAQSPGTYEFDVLWPIQDFTTAMTAALVRIYKNASYYVVCYKKISSYTSGDVEAFSGTIRLNLDAGDTVTSSVLVTGGAGNTADLYRTASVFYFSGKQL